MADNPFADYVNSLNGIILKDGSFAFAGGDVDQGQSDIDTLYVSTAYIGSYSNRYTPGTLIVDNADYRPASYSSFGRQPPIFGKVHLSGFTWGDNSSGYIVGFSSDGSLLISTNAPAYTVPNMADASRASFLINPNGKAADTSPYVFETNPADIVVCFAQGTRIETAAGSVAVEDLAKGDIVRTASGAERPITWIGTRVVNPAIHRRPHDVNPVLVRAHAFGVDMPLRDVRLSPAHAVFVEGVLVPVGRLVNGATIVQEQVETVRYYHVELESHDVLIADGLPCESYLDDGNRNAFGNAFGFTQLHGRLDPKNWDDACAPMVAAGPQLIELRQRLHDRAEELGWHKSEEPELRIVAGGVEIAPLHQSGNRYWFAVPGTDAITLRSANAVLAHVMPGLADTRSLGVAVSELRIDGTALELEDAAFGAGFYPAERHEATGWRWTDGEATLAFRCDALAMIEVQLAMVAPSWRREAPQLRVVA